MNERAPYSLVQLTLYFLRLGSIGFGGPVALVGYMYRDLVEARRWITDEDYREGLALSQLMPGPLAAQLAIYLGYMHYRIVGARELSVFLMAAGFTVWTQSVSVWLFLGAGLLVWLIRARPKHWFGNDAAVGAVGLWESWTPACSVGTGWDCSVLAQISVFFAKAGAFVFGSGLAIVPFLYAGVVNEHHWLTEHQFVDAVAVAMITPGPVVITVGFIGYLIAGLSGATVAALATFLPCYLFTVVPAPYFKKYGKRPALVAFVNGVTAAAIGAIAGAVVVLAQRSIVDSPGILIALVTMGLIWKARKLPVWTKADSVTLFDDFTYRRIERK